MRRRGKCKWSETRAGHGRATGGRPTSLAIEDRGEEGDELVAARTGREEVDVVGLGEAERLEAKRLEASPAGPVSTARHLHVAAATAALHVRPRVEEKLPSVPHDGELAVKLADAANLRSRLHAPALAPTAQYQLRRTPLDTARGDGADSSVDAGLVVRLLKVRYLTPPAPSNQLVVHAREGCVVRHIQCVWQCDCPRFGEAVAISRLGRWFRAQHRLPSVVVNRGAVSLFNAPEQQRLTGANQQGAVSLGAVDIAHAHERRLLLQPEWRLECSGAPRRRFRCWWRLDVEPGVRAEAMAPPQ